MPADAVVTRAGPVAVPLDYTVPTGTEIVPRVVSARFNGANAGGPWVPVLEVIAPTGAVTAYCARQVQYAAGASALVSFFPGVAEADAATSSASSAGTVSSITSPHGTLTVNNGTGPTVNVDMPDTGVPAGTYGDASHSAQVTVDAQGRLTGASQVGIAGGSGTIGFEVGYDQITTGVNITATTLGTANTIIACAAHTFDGAAVLLTVFFPFVKIGSSAAAQIWVVLNEGGVNLGELGSLGYPSGTLSQIMPWCLQYRFTPSAGNHTYTIAAFTNSTTGTPACGAGAAGSGAFVPAFARFTKV